jgi:hypothetical protein
MPESMRQEGTDSARTPMLSDASYGVVAPFLPAGPRMRKNLIILRVLLPLKPQGDVRALAMLVAPHPLSAAPFS